MSLPIKLKAAELASATGQAKSDFDQFKAKSLGVAPFLALVASQLGVCGGPHESGFRARSPRVEVTSPSARRPAPVPKPPNQERGL
jgi:hypothetical protein